MAETPRYGKPCMSNLPADLGKRIIVQIHNSPPPDREKIKRNRDATLNAMIAERSRADAEKRR